MIKIRRASVDDASIILEMRKRAFEDELNMYKLVPPDFGSIDMQIKKIQETCYYVILEDDQIIGGACISEESSEQYCLNSIYIDKCYQGKGYGSEFLELLEREFPDAISWCLETPYLSFNNHDFYEKHGYKKVGEYIPEYSEDKSFRLFKYEKLVNNRATLTQEGKPMRDEKEMLDLIIKTAEADSRIRAVIISGSRSNPNSPRDIFQDFDIIYIVTNVSDFTKNHEWISRFGEIIIMQTPELIEDPPPKNDGSFTFLMQFKDGNRIDICLYPINKISELKLNSLSVLLLDKDKYIRNLYRINGKKCEGNNE